MKLLLLSCAVVWLTLPVWAADPLDAAPTDYPATSVGLNPADSSGAILDNLYDSSADAGQHTNLEKSVFRREAPVAYHANGRRDPFRALLAESRKGGEIHTDLLVLQDATLTGVVWSGQDRLAMVKDKDGTAFFLREGDPVYGGRVVEITQAEAIFVVSSFGDSDRITLKVRK